MTKRIHYLQHVPFEGIGSMQAYFDEKKYPVTSTHLYKDEVLPALEQFDWLVIMGGPMGVHDIATHPWLLKEKRFIKDVIDSGKLVMGICLGAQLIADVLGAKVYKNKQAEIGWFNIEPVDTGAESILSSIFNDEIEAFHWHGDTFAIPDSALAFAKSAACENQGFVFEDRVVGFQFHLETTLESAKALLENCRDELIDSEFIQSEPEILSDKTRFSAINKVMSRVLAKLDMHHS